MKAHFFQVEDSVFSLGLCPRDLAVYLCLVMHTNRQTGVAFPSRKTIAAECGIKKVDTVDKALKVLEARGLIRKRRQYLPSGNFGSSVYTVLADKKGDAKASPIDGNRMIILSMP